MSSLRVEDIGRSPVASVFGRAPRWVRRKIGRLIVRRANAKRNAAYWAEAAELYRLALIFVPERQDIAVQAGNCFKEAGRYDAALRHYDLAADPTHRSEAMFQKGDALARGGAAADAIDALEAARDLGHPRAEFRLSEVSQFGLLGTASLLKSPPRFNEPLKKRYLLNRLTRGKPRDRRWLRSLDRTTHEREGGAGVFWRDHVAFTQVGWLKVKHQERSEPLLTGVVAIRARIVSSAPVERARLSLDGRAVAEATPIQVDQHASGRRLYALNIWLDAAALPTGRRSLVLSVVDVAGGEQSIRTVANIVRTPPDLDLSDSDAFVSSSAAPRLGDAADEVSGRPAAVHRAARSFITEPVREVLFMRVDQLGDLSASLPAIKRLRDLFPQARLTALVAPGLGEIVSASGLCDEVLSLSLSYDPVVARRYLEASEEKRVRAMLARRQFDVAVDLCPGDETRPLLKLVDAHYLVGFNPRAFDYLDFGLDVISRDKVNRIAKTAHASSVLTLIQGLEEAMNAQRVITRRLSDDGVMLADVGLTPNSFVVVHTGARHPLNRWPIENFLAVVDRFIEATGAPVVFFSDAPLSSEQLVGCRNADRIMFLQKTPFDLFDALISNCTMMLGNDSGPKHLAAARGVETVSIHGSRQNWSEWGQDGRGLIVAKKVPCNGCGVNSLEMCAKDALCITSISVDDVFGAVMDRWRHVRNASPSLPEALPEGLRS